MVSGVCHGSMRIRKTDRLSSTQSNTSKESSPSTAKPGGSRALCSDLILSRLGTGIWKPWSAKSTCCYR